MRKLFTLAVVIAATLVAIPAQAQFKFGLKGGLNITDMSFSSDVFESSNRAGFFVGLGVDASALYDQRQAKLKGSDKSMKQHAINIPINLRYDIGLGSLAAVYLAAGPQFGFNIGDKHQTLLEDMYDWRLNTSNFSVNVGAGVMLLGHLQVGANYNIVCGKTGKVSVLQTTGDVLEGIYRGRSNSWQVSLAYYF